jgi:hypothetical protein
MGVIVLGASFLAACIWLMAGHATRHKLWPELSDDQDAQIQT